jgi:hypothetical protein
MPLAPSITPKKGIGMSNNKSFAKEAGYARSNLITFGAVIAILESGCVYGPNTAADRIIKLCQSEMQRQLRIMDKNLDKVQP